MTDFVAQVVLGEGLIPVGQLRYTHAGPRQFSVFSYVNRRSIGTPYRRAKGTPLLSWWVVDAGRGFRAAGGVGRA